MLAMYVFVEKRCQLGFPLQDGYGVVECSKRKPCPVGFQCEGGVCCALGNAAAIYCLAKSTTIMYAEQIDKHKCLENPSPNKHKSLNCLNKF